VRGTGDIAQDAQNLGDVFGTDGRGKREGLLRLQAILPPFLRRVRCDKHHHWVERAPECSRLCGEHGYRGLEIHIVEAQVNVSDHQIRIERSSDAEEICQLFVDGLGVPAQVDVALSSLRLQARQAGDFRCGSGSLFFLHALQLPQAFRDNGVSRIYHQRGGQFIRGLVEVASQGVTLGCVNVGTN